MKTAVEWLIEKHFGSIENCSPNFRNHIEQANKIFEEQIMDAYNDGVNDECIGGSKTPEQYYKETFKSE
jgi:hypothetical protein